MKKFFLALALPLVMVQAAFAQVPPSPVLTPTPVPEKTPAPAGTPNPTVAPNGTPIPGATPIQDPRKDDTPGGDKKGGAGPQGTPTPTPDPNATPKPKTIEELTKGYEKVEGLFTLYRKTSENRQRLMAEIKESQIGPLFMLQTTFATGNAGSAVAGRPADDTVWHWVKTPDNRLAVVAPNLWYRASDPNLKIAVERDFPEAYLDVTPILATSTERKSVLIDFAGFFDGSIPGLNTAFQGGALSELTGAGSYSLDPELSFMERLKNFPTNLVVESLFHYRRAGSSGGSQTQADPRSLPIRVAFNVYGLPTNDGYKPRLADPRIGFFINGQLSANRSGFENFDDEAAKDPSTHYINRWNLQKANPDAKMSPPVKPIVFILDDSIPLRYRKSMREGILAWNATFERLGITGAIIVRDAPKQTTTQDQDYDHADMRFNTLRWVASPPSGSGAYAVAQIRENPMTGEILNASITMNANFARVSYREKNQVIDPLAAEQLSHNLTGEACELDGQMVDNTARGMDAAQAADPRFKDEQYVDDMLRAIICHEFGHILGLRHNFIGSMYLTPQQLANPQVVRANNVSASIMDYVGFNIFGLHTKAPLFSRGPGKYDYWAISYGYTADEKALKPIAARNGEPGLIYYGDELADGYDPTNVRYDLSSDPLAYSEKSFGVTRYLLQTIGKREPKYGQSYAYFTRRFRSLLSALTVDADNTERFIGGYRVRRVVKGDKVKYEPFSPVPLDQQQRALDLMKRFVFDESVWRVPQSYLTKTTPDLLDINDQTASSAFPIRDQISSLRTGLLVDLFAPDRLARLANGEFKFPGQMLPLTSLFNSARVGVWGTVGPQTVYSALQRDLARNHLQLLLNMAGDKVNGAPLDARLLAQGDLKTLRAKLIQTARSSPDQITRLFAQDSVRRIDTYFKPKTQDS
ncbi:hypothetical protein IAD21_01463 [Abditibacteriota bacterium]|nr:hypothetical protein IAD21_01463 [Abditibacteriota bacterium]